MDFYEQLKSYKEAKGLSNEEMGKYVFLSSDAFRMAVKRETLNELQKQALEPLFVENLSDDHIIHQQLKITSRFFAQYTDLALKDSTINKVISKEMAKRLYNIISNKEALEKFLNS